MKMNELMCACGKHESELKELLGKNERMIKLWQELLKEQAEEIFEKLENCCEMCWSERIRPLKQKWVGKPK